MNFIAIDVGMTQLKIPDIGNGERTIEQRSEDLGYPLLSLFRREQRMNTFIGLILQQNQRLVMEEEGADAQVLRA
ncbi:hypothetical protein D3C80_2025160 [compost metagenome]